ncbi:MAG: TIGR04372 family glycosyltransferase [Actinobacteria bacterium]|nr:TIGR04372 family glycosyltransferase [Actinomycetota bacterium]MTA65016.1 TIGR04372 family glycosyltransferase [Actinomycetota bacterium]
MGLLTGGTYQAMLDSLEWSRNHYRNDLVIYFFRNKKSSNKFMSELLQRELFTITGNFGEALFFAARKVPGMSFFDPTDVDDYLGLYKKYSIPPKFREAELKAGFNYLDSVISGPDKKFVCLLVRDSAYMNEISPNRDNSYTDYRDSDIGSYIKAADALADLGYTVFRMGAQVEKKLASKHPKVIDYATNGMRSEFLDVFLCAHCSFILTTGTGLDEVSRMFQRPVSYVNIIPVSGVNQCEALVYPKIICDRETNLPLTLRQIAERDLQFAYFQDLYDAANVFVRDMTEDEILSFALESVSRLERSWTPTYQYLELEEKRINLYNSITKLRFHPTIVRDPDTIFASCFYENYPNFLD